MATATGSHAQPRITCLLGARPCGQNAPRCCLPRGAQKGGLFRRVPGASQKSSLLVHGSNYGPLASEKQFNGADGWLRIASLVSRSSFKITKGLRGKLSMLT